MSVATVKAASVVTSIALMKVAVIIIDVNSNSENNIDSNFSSNINNNFEHSGQNYRSSLGKSSKTRGS